MTSRELIKIRLAEDKEKLIQVLENLGCHHINPNYGGDEIRCALPDGTTINSVSIKQTPFLPVQIYSRPGYEEFSIQDVFSLVMFVRKCNFSQALDWLCSVIGIENDGIVYSSEFSILKEIRREKGRQKRKHSVELKHQVLDKNILNKYNPVYVNKWIEEGISSDTQKKFGIRDDPYNKRYLIPIYDENGNLISIKGRTYAPNWEQLGVQKYIYYHKLGVSDILFGVFLNKENIKLKNEIILFEAEKSVMAADSYGYGWSSSLGTNHITEPLLKKILSLSCSNVVLALDKDVDWKTVVKEANKIKRYKNVWVIYDRKNLLSNKDSPTDKGKEIFETLYSEKIRII